MTIKRKLVKFSIPILKKKVKVGYNRLMDEQNYKAFWNEALNLIHEEYKQQGKETEFEIWFKMDYIKDTLKEITVAVPSNFMWSRMVSMGYVKAVQDKMYELTGQNVSLTYIAKNVFASSEQKPQNTIQSYTDISQTKTTTIQRISNTETVAEKNDVETEMQPLKKHPQLNENHTFETFVPGENSDFAYKVSQAAAENPGDKKFNPLLIYGGVGLGKTHLMQSIGNYIYKKRGGNVKICYIMAEKFTTEFISSIEKKTMEKFKAKYRTLDVLLVDDIHFLIGKDSTQEELFYTFEALQQNHAQMVFTCDRPITELKDIEGRLRTRLSSGISIDLQPPSYETRQAILKNEIMLANKTEAIPQEVIDLIAKNVQTNVRDLKSCLNTIINWVDIMKKPLTIDIAQNQLRDIFSQPAGGSITIERIQKVVAEHYNISLSDIKSNKRNKKFTIPRHIAIYISRELGDYSYPEIGEEFGGRDHTTIMASYNKISNQLKTDSMLDTTIQMLIRAIKDYHSK